MRDFGKPPPDHDRRCVGHTSDGTRCARWAIKGSTVCPTHGGSTRHIKGGAERRVKRAKAEEQAGRLVAAEKLVPVGDPVAVLTQLASEALRLAKVTRDMSEKLDHWRYESVTGEHLRAEVGLYERALDRAEKFCMGLAKLDLEDRAQKLREQQAQLIVAVFEAVFEELGLTGDDYEHATAVASRRLAAAS